MRRVQFRVYDNGKWHDGEGNWHQWAAACVEFESGPGNYTVGIVEDDNGQVWTPVPENVKFLQT